MFNDNFYPTPKHLTYKMLSGIDFRTIRTVLEPSAGSGNLAEEVLNKFKNVSYHNREQKFDIDTIEIDTNLQHILKGKGFRVIHDDFLTYNTMKKYDLIILNPPFDQGEKHLLKCIEMQQQGGQIVCLLNTETLKNPYSNTRKDLLNKLEQYNAEIEYFDNAFTDAERKTNVSVALIKINIPKTIKESVIINNLKREEQHQQTKKQYNTNSLIHSDFIEGIIQQYNFEVKAGINLINEYENLIPLTLKSFKKDSYNSDSILKLGINDSNYNRYGNSDDTLVNAYIKKVRYKYWEALFTSDNFTQLLTSDLQSQYMNKISELVDYDFSYYNIKQIQIDINKVMMQSVEDTIYKLFEEFSYQSSWDREFSKNIHYYNGWASNSCWKVNKKIIQRLNAFDTYSGSLNYDYKVIRKLMDIEKALNYLEGGITEEEIDIQKTLKEAEKECETKNIMFKHFSCTFYKKGTVHLTFNSEELLQKFNRFGSMKKGFLPPSYGKKSYKDMTPQEKKVINEFEGEEIYNKVMKNKNLYLYNPSGILMLDSAI